MSGPDNTSGRMSARMSDGDFEALKDEIKARVKLSEVIGRHGVKLKRNGREFQALSPFTNEKTPSFTVNDEKQFYHCFSSGSHGDIFAWLMFSQNMTFGQALSEGRKLAGLSQGPLSIKQVEQRKRENTRRSESQASYQKRMMDHAFALWQQSVPAGGTLVETYLRGGVDYLAGGKCTVWGRHIDLDLIGGIPAAIRFHPNVRNPSGESFPAMVTEVTGRAGAFTGLHITFLRSDGRDKIDVSRPRNRNGPKGKKRLAKQILGAYFGGSARLITPGGSPFAAGNNILSVGEGVESELSAYQLYVENGKAGGQSGGMWWAALSLGNLTGAQAQDKWGKPKFSITRKGPKRIHLGKPVGTPVPDINRPGFLPPSGWSGNVRNLCEDDLKDDPKRGLTGSERAERAYALAAAKFKHFVGGQTMNSWPGAGQDFNDILRERAKAKALANIAYDNASNIGIPKEFQTERVA